ncbi:MAG TPA: hypothetical protein PKC43_13125 [Phycisphaerales bacterium]|nr:hypothetical protein [Phycisphaerales bacterium]HMP38374.1 hypothetical protein [Phycisphaerales bacterium]
MISLALRSVGSALLAAVFLVVAATARDGSAPSRGGAEDAEAPPLASPSSPPPPAASPASAAHPPAPPASGTIAALRDFLAIPRSDRGELAAQAFAIAPLDRAEAELAAALLWSDREALLRDEATEAWQRGEVVLGEDTMRLLIRRYGDAPHGRRSLWISLHGGGGTRPAINDGQWRNQIELYQPGEGISIAPRALQDTWDLWHEPRIDRFIARIVECAIAIEGVDPDRVYLLGYSAGGDGVYRLGPRLGDRLAAASMMAGHPGDADPRSLRNLPFAVQVGAEDAAYDRNIRAREWGERLAALRDADPGGYPHLVRVHDGLGHWMELRDAFVLEWMARHTRVAWPTRVVWHQHTVTHPRFAWLGVAEEETVPGRTIVAERRRLRPRRGGEATQPGAPATAEGLAATHAIEIVQADVGAVTLWLSDALIDLDRPVVVRSNGRTLHDATVGRTIATLAESLAGRSDPRLMAPAKVRVELDER